MWYDNKLEKQRGKGELPERKRHGFKGLTTDRSKFHK